MSLSIKNRHDNIHKFNPTTNYIKIENCKFCIVEKRKGYGKYANNINMYNTPSMHGNFQTYWYNSILGQFSQTSSKPYLKSKIFNTIINIKTSEQDTCSICLNNFNTNASFLNKCHHIFHKSCLEEWLNYNNTCPLCRTFID
jgi:hypothetical protein